MEAVKFGSGPSDLEYLKARKIPEKEIRLGYPRKFPDGDKDAVPIKLTNAGQTI